MNNLTTRQRQHVAAHRASGASYAAYALAHDIDVQTLKGWAQRVRDEERAGLKFARVVPMERPRAATLTVEVGGDVRIVVGEDFDERLLARVVGALRGTGA